MIGGRTERRAIGPAGARDGIRFIDPVFGPGWWHYVLDFPTPIVEGSTECDLPIPYVPVLLQ